MTPIRPNALPVQPASTPGVGADAARQAAQKAFFDAAMGRAAPPPAATVAPAPQAARPSLFAAAPAAVQRAEIRPDPGAEPPARPLRPGSLLDIRV